MTRTDIALLTAIATVVLIAAAIGNARAEPAATDSRVAPPSAATCIDTHLSYRVHVLNRHDALVRTTLGTPKPPVRIKTTCINLLRADHVALSAQFNCLDQGDGVVAVTIDGRGESCRVVAVVPFAPQDGDRPEKN